MPSLQPLKMNVPENAWDEMLKQLNFLFSDIYHYIDTVMGVDNKVFAPGMISLPNEVYSVTFANDGVHILDTDGDFDLILSPGSNLTADRVLTITTGDAARTITLNGNPTLDNLFDQGVKTTSSVQFADLTLNNEGLHLLDTDASHDLIIKPGSNLTADRILTITTGDAARTITLNGNPTLDDWFDQAVKQASSPTFAGVTVSGLTASLLTQTDATKGLASLSKQAHIADASTAHAITDPADAPATADDLRDDLVANAIPDIESALDALGTKINSILSALETALILNTV